jgi:hypothetical protein
VCHLVERSELNVAVMEWISTSKVRVGIVEVGMSSICEVNREIERSRAKEGGR